MFYVRLKIFYWISSLFCKTKILVQRTFFYKKFPSGVLFLGSTFTRTELTWADPVRCETCLYVCMRHVRLIVNGTPAGWITWTYTHAPVTQTDTHTHANHPHTRTHPLSSPFLLSPCRHPVSACTVYSGYWGWWHGARSSWALHWAGWTFHSTWQHRVERDCQVCVCTVCMCVLVL